MRLTTEERRFSALAERLHTSTGMGIVRASQRVTPCCHEGAHRDGIIVTAFSPATVVEATDAGSTTAATTVNVYAVDEHAGRVLLLMLDVESLERHVNDCTEVLAYVRRRNEGEEV